MNILLVNTLYSPFIQGGAEISTLQLAEKLKSRGHNVHVLSTSNKKNENINEVNGVTNYRVHIPHIFWRYHSREQNLVSKIAWRIGDLYNPLGKSKIMRVIKTAKPDVIHTNNIAGFSVSLWKYIKEFRLPIVHTTRDYYLLCKRTSMFRRDKACNSQCTSCRLINYHKQVATRYVDAVIGISQHILDSHLRNGFFDSTPIKAVIPNSINRQLGLEVKAKKEEANLIFGYLGTVTPLKGVELLLKAYSDISNNHNVTLLIGGREYQNGYVKSLRKKYSQARNLRFLGYVSKEEFFKKIDVLIHPALWNEPFGRIIIEAFSHGRPVISSDRGGLSDINRDGKTGYVLKQLNPLAIQNCMAKYLNNKNLLNKHSLAALKESEKYDITKIVGEHLNIYTSLLNEEF